jgi:hypothetical protein
MPRLLRKAARAALVSSAVRSRQGRRSAGPGAPVPSEPLDDEQIPEQRSEPSTTDRLEQLKALGELKAQGVLTADEFDAEKAKILAR